VWKMSEDFFFNEVDYQDRLDEIRPDYLEWVYELAKYFIMIN
jgi:hypothetical protein